MNGYEKQWNSTVVRRNGIEQRGQGKEWKRAERISARTVGTGLETRRKGIEKRGQGKEQKRYAMEKHRNAQQRCSLELNC